MARLKFRDGQWIDKDTGKPVPTENKFDFSKPWTGNIAADYEGYECPVNGTWIEGRKAHEENLKLTGCRVLEPGEKEDNVKKASVAAEKEDARRDAAIDGIVDSVGAEYFS